MKRSEIKRKTPLRSKSSLRRTPMRRTGSNLKRGTLRRISEKKIKAIEEAADDRALFAWEFPQCMHCRKRRWRDTHEIPRGGLRPAAYRDRRGWLRLCRPCHDLFDDYRKVPLAVALAVKQRSDPEYYDLAWINTTRHRAQTGIEQSDVDAAARALEAA